MAVYIRVCDLHVGNRSSEQGYATGKLRDLSGGGWLTDGVLRILVRWELDLGADILDHSMHISPAIDDHLVQAEQEC